MKMLKITKGGYIRFFSHTPPHADLIDLFHKLQWLLYIKHQCFRSLYCNMQGSCCPNECPKQDCIVVPPPSNIMEVQKNKKNTYYSGQYRTLNNNFKYFK